MDYLSTNGFNFQFDLKDHNILIVDDNPTNLAVIVDYLEDSGLTILVSQDGESSLKRAKYAKPGLILLDVLMPGLDGYETCRRLKDAPETRDIPVIFMTALSSTEDKVKGFEVGAVDYVTKPFQPEEVLARIKLHLQLRFMTQTLSQKNQTLEWEIQQRKTAETRLKTINYQLQQEIEERLTAQESLKKLNEELENIVEKRTIELININRQLKQENIERQQVETQVRKALKEKEILLKEIHHRVKNNLLVVSSLLAFQTEFIKDEAIIKMFDNSQNRIHSMALIHEHLYRSHNLKSIDFSQYIKSLIDQLSATYNISQAPLEFSIFTQPVLVNIETAHPCGLIVNELIANALEHGFPNNRKGKIFVSLQKQKDCSIVLKIKDNGVGFPTNLDFHHTESLGLQLVSTLIEQLEGEITLDRTEGTCFTITFSELDYCDRL